MELLQSVRRRPRQEDKITTTLLNEKMLSYAKQSWSRSAHVRMYPCVVRSYWPCSRLLNRGQFQEKKLQDPQQRRWGGRKDNEEESWSSIIVTDSCWRCFQSWGPTECRLCDDHGFRHCSRPDLLEAIHTYDLFFIVQGDELYLNWRRGKTSVLHEERAGEGDGGYPCLRVTQFLQTSTSCFICIVLVLKICSPSQKDSKDIDNIIDIF